MYGATWCPDCHRSRAYFEQHNIEYKWVNIEDDSAAADYVVKVNNGLRSIPTIVFPDGSVLVEPSNKELDEKLS